jgi:DinB superfamily
MDFRELILIQHARNHTAEVGQPDWSIQDYILNGVTESQMRLRPLPGSNSLAWLFWHMTRSEDIGANIILSQTPQIIDSGDWGERLGVSLRDGATGMTDLEVGDLTERINIEALLAYRAAVGRRTQFILRDLRPEVLDEVIDTDLIQQARELGAFGPHGEIVPQRWTGKRKAFTLSHTILGHALLHLGQADTIRSLLGLATI